MVNTLVNIGLGSLILSFLVAIYGKHDSHSAKGWWAFFRIASESGKELAIDHSYRDFAAGTGCIFSHSDGRIKKVNSVCTQ